MPRSVVRARNCAPRRRTPRPEPAPGRTRSRRIAGARCAAAPRARPAAASRPAVPALPARHKTARPGQAPGQAPRRAALFTRNARGAVYGPLVHEIERDEQRLLDARFALKSGFSAAVAECPLRATNGLVHCKGKVGRLGKLVIRTETGPQIASAGSGARIDVMILSDSGSQNWPRAIPTVVSTAASAGRVGNPRAWIAVAMTKFANGISAKPINGQCSRIMSTRRGRDGL